MKTKKNEYDLIDESGAYETLVRGIESTFRWQFLDAFKDLENLGCDDVIKEVGTEGIFLNSINISFCYGCELMSNILDECRDSPALRSWIVFNTNGFLQGNAVDIFLRTLKRDGGSNQIYSIHQTKELIKMALLTGQCEIKAVHDPLGEGKRTDHATIYFYLGRVRNKSK